MRVRPVLLSGAALALVGGFVVAPAASAAPAAAPAAVAVANPTVSGTVTGPSGFRAPGVTVSAYVDVTAAPVRTTRTTGTGAYTLANLPAERLLQICFDPSTAPGKPATGWQSTCYRTPDPAGLFVAAGATVGGVDVRLALGGVIAGTVAENPATALSGAVVTATGYGVVVDPATAARATALAGAAGVLRPSAGAASYHARTTTAADGSYRLTGLPAGRDWEVCVDGAAATGGSAFGYRMTCHGGGTPSAYSPVAVSVGATTTAAETPVRGGLLAGRVTGPGGTGVAGATVTIARPGGDPVATLTTDANGDYRRPGLAGAYTVCAQPAAGQPAPGFLRQCAGGPAGGTAAIAGTVTVTPEQATTTDLTLGQGGDARLTVTNTAGAPLPGVTVRLTAGPSPATGTSGSDGTVTLPGLVPGVYTACTGDVDDPVQKRAPSCFRLLTVRAGQETTASLVSQAGASVTGLVTTADGTPVGGAAVRVQPRDQVSATIGFDVGTPVTVRTGSDGRWTASGRLPGRYGIDVSPLRVASGPGSTATSAVEVTLAAASTTTAPTIALPAGRVIQGHVTRGASPVAGAVVEISGSAVVTDATGSYTLGGLPAAGVQTCAQRVPSTPEVTAPVCTVVYLDGSAVTTADIALRTSGPTVTGRVTTASGDPLADVAITNDLRFPPVTRTDADGRYAVTLLPPGVTTFCFSRPAGRGTPAFALQCSTFQVPAGQTVVRDVVMDEQAIRGTVTSAGHPIGGAVVTLSTARNTTTRGTAVTAPDGSYAFSGLTDPSYRVCVAAGPDLLVPFPTGLQTRCSGGSPTLAGATTVAVGGTADIDLPLGAALTGRVVDPDGQPVPGATVQVGPAAAVATTDGGGFRAMGLSAGTPQACADDPETSTRFAGYLRTCTPTPQLTAGTTTTGDVPIAFAGGISGKVISTDGSPVAGVFVSIVLVGGNGVNPVSTRADGTWSVARLPAGSYTVCFSLQGYGPECWKHRKGTMNRTPIPVTTGYTTGINGLLAPTAPKLR